MKRLYVLLAIMTFGLFALAQSPTPAAAAPVDAGQSAQWLVDLIGKYPTLAVIIFIVGGLRLTLKPLFSFLHTLLPAWGLTAWDSGLTAVEQSKAVTFIYWILDYLGSVKLPVKADKSA